MASYWTKGRICLAVLLVQALVFGGLSLAGWGSQSRPAMSAPSLLRFGPPYGLESLYTDTGHLDFPLENARGQIVGSAVCAGSDTSWADLPQKHASIDFLNPLKAVRTINNLGSAVELFVVPAGVAASQPLAVRIGGHRYHLLLAQADPSLHLDVMATRVGNHVLGELWDPIVWQTAPQTVAVGKAPVLIRTDPMHTNSRAYLLTYASVGKGTRGGAVLANLPAAADGAAVVSYTPKAFGLLGFIETSQGRARYVAVPAVVPALQSGAQFVDALTTTRPLLGVVFRTAEATARGSAQRLSGARIVRLIPGSSAVRAGLTVGDTIVAIDGQPTPSAQAMTAAAQGFQFNSVHRLLVVTPTGQESRISVTVTPIGG